MIEGCCLPAWHRGMCSVGVSSFSSGRSRRSATLPLAEPVAPALAPEAPPSRGTRHTAAELAPQPSFGRCDELVAAAVVIGAGEDVDGPAIIMDDDDAAPPARTLRPRRVANAEVEESSDSDVEAPPMRRQGGSGKRRAPVAHESAAVHEATAEVVAMWEDSECEARKGKHRAHTCDPTKRAAAMEAVRGRSEAAAARRQELKAEKSRERAAMWPEERRREDDESAADESDAGDEALAEAELQCVCGGTPAGFDGVWIGCDECGRWVHGVCGGFASAEAAEAATTYVCTVCVSQRVGAAMDTHGGASADTGGGAGMEEGDDVEEEEGHAPVPAAAEGGRWEARAWRGPLPHRRYPAIPPGWQYQQRVAPAGEEDAQPQPYVWVSPTGVVYPTLVKARRAIVWAWESIIYKEVCHLA